MLAVPFCRHALTLIACASGRVLAHHSFTMFEMDKDVTYKGVVVEYKWINPHVHITDRHQGGPGRRPGDGGDVGRRRRLDQHHGRARGGRAPR